MKILVIGSGGREHAFVWKIAQSPLVKKIYCAPGNAGMKGKATCVPIGAEDVDGLLAFAVDNGIDLTVVGPEAPLAAGVVDAFEARGLKIFGATARAAEIESSKAFCKELLDKYGIPTAEGRTFTSHKQAQAYVKSVGAPIVVKADGLAAGKGVIVCRKEKEAMDALKRIMVDKEFGEAGRKVVVEECLVGEEASFIAFTDGKTVLPLPSSQDHKPIFDDDQGPNTGGMGAYSPAPLVDRILHRRIMDEVMVPTVRAMAAEGRPYKGFLYAGLMIDRDRIRVLEFNGRLGDPEAQPLLMRLKSDLVPLMLAAVEGRLDQCRIELDDRVAVCVVMASGGYPGGYRKGFPIAGLEKAGRMKDVVVFHAGTAEKDGAIVTAGGRVLGVTALGHGIPQAIRRAYQAVEKIRWDGEQHRSDIGQKALKRLDAQPIVEILMGSDSDLPVMEAAAGILKHFDVPYRMTVASAHRSPERAARIASTAARRGVKVLIAGAGHAAHLAGAIAAHTPLPVIGVPIDSSALNGLDALLSTVQMPPGIPVATVAVGKPGARNAGILAVQMLALSDERLAAELEKDKADMARKVEAKAASLEVP
jgi:phosphoribosylamine--glycine ligase